MIMRTVGLGRFFAGLLANGSTRAETLWEKCMLSCFRWDSVHCFLSSISEMGIFVLCVDFTVVF